MTRHQQHYIPPLTYHGLTRFYDPLVRLTIALARAYPMATVTGIDADARALAIARDSALDLDLRQASSTRMPLPDESFDRVVSSLFFHHLSAA